MLYDVVGHHYVTLCCGLSNRETNQENWVPLAYSSNWETQ